MKGKIIVLIVALVLLSMPAFAQLRLDIGVDVPRGLGVSSGANDTASAFGNWPFFPMPDAGLYYQWEVSSFNIGVGARGFSVLIETALWPNAFVEWNIGPVALEFQVGGGLFALLGVYSDLTAGAVFIPDLSAWFKIGKTGAFRLGGGLVGFYAPNALGSTMPFLFYLGGKVALEL